MTCIYTGARVAVDGAKYACDVHWVPRSSVFVLRVNRKPYPDQASDAGVVLRNYLELSRRDDVRTLIVERDDVLFSKAAVDYMASGASNELHDILIGSE